MKRYILTLLIGLMAVSCSQDRIMGVMQDVPIEFRLVMDRQTKAVSYTTAGMNGFNVTAWKEGYDRSAVTPYVNQVDYTRNEANAFTSDTKYYWPTSGRLDFYAYAPKATTLNGLVRNSELSYTVTPLDDTDSQVDLVFAKNSGTKSGNGVSGVKLNFRHVMSQICIEVKNTESNLAFNVSGWKIAGVDGSATFAFDDSQENTNAEAENSQNTVPISMWSGNDDDNSKKYTKEIQPATNVTGVNTTWGELSGSAILVPQTAEAATAYSNSALNGAYIAIRYQAINAGTGDEIISSQWGCWPVKFVWEPGFRYTYIIDLSEFGYEETGTDDLDPVNGKMGIKFVNVKVDPWQPEGGTEVDVNMAGNNSQHQQNTGPGIRFSTVNSAESNKLSIRQGNGAGGTSSLEYSVDDGNSWASLAYNTYVAFGNGTDILVRGNDFHSDTVSSQIKYFKFEQDNVDVNCEGDISRLISGAGAVTTLPHNEQFAYLFKDCACLKTVPELPATTLTDNCYYNMFSGCTGLTAAPELPASAMAENCYRSMFSGCTGLTTPPELPGVTMAESCYRNMFSGCTALASAPALPGTTLARECYRSMFSGCTGIESAPALSVTQLAVGCYRQMFQGCTQLTSAPVLPATTMTERCYAGMFQDCSALPETPQLPSNALAKYCYESMFAGCTSVNDAPALPAAVMAEGCYESMFEDCTDLDATPALNSMSLAKGCYRSMFRNCTEIASMPSLPAQTMAHACYNSMFEGCSGLTSAITLQSTALADSCYCAMYKGCSSLPSVPDMPATVMAPYCYSDMYEGCTGFTDLPVLATTTLDRFCYSGMFRGCTGLVDVSASYLPFTTLAAGCYSYMFEECCSLTTVFELPATVMADSCYQGFYKECRAADREIPTDYLPSTELAVSCYQEMFYHCNFLWTMPAISLPASIMKDYCYARMFSYSNISNQYSFFNQLPSLSAVTKLAPHCFDRMFSVCENLNRDLPSDYLPFTELAEFCYDGMFGDSRVTAAPQLPATVLKQGCYEMMFANTHIKSITLPATTLAQDCYNWMFVGCDKLESIDIHATVLVPGCYTLMCLDCHNLSYVRAMFTDVSAADQWSTYRWLEGVAATGTFVKHPSATWPEALYVPEGWTVVTDSE